VPFPLHPQQCRVWHWQGHVAALVSGFQWKMAKGHPHLGAAAQQCMHQDTPANARNCPHRSSCCTAVCDRATAASTTATTSTTTTAADTDTGAPITTTTARAVYPWGGREGGRHTTPTSPRPRPRHPSHMPCAPLHSSWTVSVQPSLCVQSVCNEPAAPAPAPAPPTELEAPEALRGLGDPCGPPPAPSIDTQPSSNPSINRAIESTTASNPAMRLAAAQSECV
jgi:hypothetical protein